MPTSFYGQISIILGEIIRLNPKSILDIGVGFGKYGVLCREMLDIPYQRYSRESWQVRIDGIEGYKGYNNPIHTYVYNNIYYKTVEEVIDDINDIYDLGLMIDILEHFEKEKGREMLSRILTKCTKLIVSIPALPSPQNYLDNELEDHKSIWEVKDFMEFKLLKVEIVPMEYNNSSIILLM